MPRPRKTRNEGKSAMIAIRLTQSQRVKLSDAAEQAGVSISGYLSHLIDGDVPNIVSTASAPDVVPYTLLAQWQRAGNNINQLARSVHRGRDQELDWLLGALRELLTLMVEDQISRRYAMRFGADALVERVARTA